MRLGQLARKLDVKVNEIVDFLNNEHNISIESDLNTKIEGEALDFVMNNYKVDEIIEEKITEPDVVEDVKPEKIQEVIDEVPETIVETEVVENADNEIVSNEVAHDKLVVESEDGEEIELNVVDGVIKAPKKELSGFKVVGQIDLSEPKKSVQHIKTDGEVTTNVTDEITAKRKEIAQIKREKYLKRKAEKKKRQDNKKKRNKRKVLSELEIKEKQAELLVEKRLKQAQIDKEKKRKHYEQLTKNKKTTPSKKSKKKKKVDESVVKTVKQFDKEPTTTLGKIWKWFNT